MLKMQSFTMTVATGLIALLLTPTCFAIPMALEVSGTSVDKYGLFGPIGRSLNMSFTVKYDTTQPNYWGGSNIGYWGPVGLAVMVHSLSLAHWGISQESENNMMMIVAKPMSPSSHAQSLLAESPYVEPLPSGFAPRGDAIYDIVLGLWDPVGQTFFDNSLPLPVDNINAFMQSATIAFDDAQGHAIDGNFFSLTNWSAKQIAMVPEPNSVALIGLGLAGLRFSRHKRKPS